MSEGWRPLQAPSRPVVDGEPVRSERGSFAVSPFVRLARVHALSSAGDAMVTVALAGSLFFSIDPSAARWRVGLYLALTIAPFALVSPLIGPAIDRARGGRRLMVIVINAGRATVAALMIGNLDSLFLFPLAFSFLVLQKGYVIAKAAIVPTTVRSHDELVDKNSRLALLSGIAGFAGAAPAALVQVLGGPEWSVLLAAIVFVVATALSTRLPRVAVAVSPEDEAERAELRSGGIVLAASAMGMLRAIIGFFTFLVAFAYRGGTDDLDLGGDGRALGVTIHESLLGVDVGAGGTSAVRLGAVVAFSVGGGLIGSLVAPRLRQRVAEETMVLGALLGISIAALLGTWSGGLSGALLVGLAVGVGVSSGKLAFDSLVQRDAPDANYGRTFARFETRFQLLWVFGALVPVVITLPARFGFFILCVAAGLAALSYHLGSRAGEPDHPLRLAPPIPQPLQPRPPAAPAPDDPTLVDLPLRDPALDDTLDGR
jgi:hypothetical protein